MAALYGCLTRWGKTLDGVGRNGWKRGLFGCAGDCADLGAVECKTCLCTSYCACCQYALTDAALGDNFLSSLLVACCCFPCAVAVQRSRVREKHNVPGTKVDDCVVSCCCGVCAVCQSANEVGEDAAFTAHTVETLLVPPSAETMREEAAQAAEFVTGGGDAGDGDGDTSRAEES